MGHWDYRDEVELDLLGRRVRVLELSREVSPTMPVYSDIDGHQHDESG